MVKSPNNPYGLGVETSSPYDLSELPDWINGGRLYPGYDS